MFTSEIEWDTHTINPNNEQLIIIELSEIKTLYCMMSTEIRIDEDTIEYPWDIISSYEGHTREEVSICVEKVRDGDGTFYCDPEENHIYLTMAHAILGQWLESEILGRLPSDGILK